MLSVGSLFTGIGMLDYGLHLAGLTDHRWVCEQDEWRRERILAQRFPDAVRYADVRDAGHGWEPVELVAGGFPCKGASTAGKREGFDHPETVLWREMARAVRELRPRYVLVENVANILGLHDGAVWGEVLGDLAALGYDVTWDCLPAAAVGAPHLRDRVFAVAAHPDRMAGPPSESRHRSGGEVARPREVERAERLHSDAGAAADSVLAGLEGAGVRGAASDRAGRADAAPADAAGGPEGREPEDAAGGLASEPHGGRRSETSTDAARDAEGRPEAAAGAERERARPRAGVAVEWGAYEPAIRRWEALAGPAPEPLLRGVDARPARRVVRSRLSALGDGVQVQVGYLAGRYIIELEMTALQGQRGRG